MIIKLGNGSIYIDEKVKNLLNNRVLLIKITMEKGPCTDELCPLIRKVSCEINDNYKFDSTYKIHEPVKIEMYNDIYNSINKERENIKIKKGFKGIEIKGISLVGTV
jgi:hypothetical protein